MDEKIAYCGFVKEQFVTHSPSASQKQLPSTGLRVINGLPYWELSTGVQNGNSFFGFGLPDLAIGLPSPQSNFQLFVDDNQNGLRTGEVATYTVSDVSWVGDRCLSPMRLAYHRFFHSLISCLSYPFLTSTRSGLRVKRVFS